VTVGQRGPYRHSYLIASRQLNNCFVLKTIVFAQFLCGAQRFFCSFMARLTGFRVTALRDGTIKKEVARAPAAQRAKFREETPITRQTRKQYPGLL